MSKEHPHSHELYTEQFDDLNNGDVKYLLLETEDDIEAGDEIEVFELDIEDDGRTGRCVKLKVTSVAVGDLNEGIEVGWCLLSVERIPACQQQPFLDRCVRCSSEPHRVEVDREKP